jgi:2-polyprenyl-6-methoxyphenol hydroxylase-like FAD-dependent oxidoreductase
LRVIISGGGIGGLATALALHHVGITDIQILESVKEIKPLGVGINILPHAVRELTELGLGDDLDAIGVRTADLSYISEHGSVIWSEPRGRDAGYLWPQYSVHRGRFQMLLAQKVRERLGPDVLRTDARVMSERTEGDTVILETSAGEFRGDLLIAAEGIKSSTRAAWHPEEGDPIWSGAVLWRATSRARPFLTGRSMFMAGYRNLKFVAYPLSPVGEDGLQEINWIAEQVDPDMTDLQNDWNRVVPISRFAHLFANWNWEWLNIPELISTADEVLEYPMVDREPLSSWVRGRTVLLGDAAHPTYPVGSNGTSQALLDARCLAYALAAKPLEEALSFYENERVPKTAALQNANRKMGPELVLQMVHERAPHGFTSIHDVIPQVELDEIAQNYKKVAGFDQQTLNSRPSWDALLEESRSTS